jgi:5-methylcytosine-specific restriction enzyme B
MSRAPWAPASLYEVAASWSENCLRGDGSLFTPGLEVWTRAAVDEAADRLLTVDARKLDFMTKLRDQLDGVSDAALQFSAELLCMHTLTISNAGVDAKRALVEPVLSWMRTPFALTPELIEPFSGGVANYGAGLAQRDRYVRYFVAFVQEWKKLDGEEVARLLADPWGFRELVHGLGGPALMQREAILHLAFRDTFEYAIAPDDKRRIVKAFALCRVSTHGTTTVRSGRSEPLSKDKQASRSTCTWRNTCRSALVRVASSRSRRLLPALR